jgi:competence protein ComEC
MIPDLIWQSAAVTIIAQAGTLPLTVMLFNRFPVWFIISNVIIVPLSSLVVISGMLVLISYPLQFLSHLLAVAMEILTHFTETLTERAASLPLSTIENIGFSTIQCIFLTITLFLLLCYLLDRKSLPVFYPLALFFLFISTGTIKDLSNRKSAELIVYNTIGNTTIGVKTGRTLTYYSDTLAPVREVDRHKAMSGLKEKREKIHGNACISINGKYNVLITNLLTTSILNKSSPEIVVLTGTKPVIESNMRMIGDLKALVIGQEAVQRLKMPLIKADTVHFIRNAGAFYLRL